MIFQKFLQSIRGAGEGLKHVFKNERNFRVQIAVAVVVLIAVWYFPLSRPEMLLVISLIFAVLVMEVLNTAMETFTDLLKPRLHHYVKNVKDIMAGAVLLTSLGAAIVGLIIFLPRFIDLFR